MITTLQAPLSFASARRPSAEVISCWAARPVDWQAPPWKPSKIIVCEEIQSANPAAICARTCATWARSQPDFQISLDACMANCQPKKTCSELQVR